MTIQYSHLLGLAFNHGVQDCYTLCQRFYGDNYGIVLPDIVRPDEWWAHGMNLYQDHFFENGFRSMDDMPLRELRVGDGFIMAIGSAVPCHAAIYVGEGNILHHFYGRFSNVEPYKGIWRNSTTATLRHRDVPPPEMNAAKVDIMELLPPAKRKQLQDALAARQV
jgi:cell wall-associated NlpC family hydrolase